MVRRIFTTGRITNEQIRGVYEYAAKIGVEVMPWNEGPAADRSTFKWAAQGGILAVRKMLKHLRLLP